MSDSLRSVLPILHGLFNFSVLLLFVYQAALGLRIRRARKAGALSMEAVTKHRRNGPRWAILAGLGYLAGLVVVTIDQGRIFSFPPHFVLGTVLVLSIFSTYLISRRIDEKETWRNRHFRLGIFILTVYGLQALAGVGVLVRLRAG